MIMDLLSLDKKHALALQKHFDLSNYQMLILSWVMGLVIGFGLGLILHSAFLPK